MPDVGDTLDLIKASEPDANFTISSMSDDNTRWIATIWEPKRPATYALIDRETEAITELFSARPDLKPYRLSGMRTVTIPSRDGLDLVSYLTLPPDEPTDRPARALAASAQGAWRTMGARPLRLPSRSPMAGQSRLRSAVGELQGLDRLRKSFRQCR